MINLASAALKVFLAVNPTDMRKSLNGLCAIAYDDIGQTLAHEALFVFCNKRWCIRRITGPTMSRENGFLAAMGGGEAFR